MPVTDLEAIHDDPARARSEVTAAVAGGRLRLVAQPIVDPHSGVPELYELLLRLRDDRGRLLAPRPFLAVAERFDTVEEIDRWVLRHGLALLADPHGPHAVSVNVSARSVGGRRLTDTIAEALSDTGTDPSRLVLELTETAAVTDLAELQRFTHRAADLGCRLALDDFGAGYGSFRYLKHLPFDYLKIDGQFVAAAPDNAVDALIVDAVRDLAHGLGKRVVAEFVADQRVLDWSRDRGLDLVQGFHVGRPQPVGEAFAAARVA